MKTKFFAILLICSCLLFVFFTTINLAGKWEGTLMVSPQMSIPISYNFNVEKDSLLTGSFIGPEGTVDIENGLIKGNDFSFDFQGNSGRVHTSGKYYEDSITVAMEAPSGPVTGILKRAK